MSGPALLHVEKLEVVYHRTITAVQGFSFTRAIRADRRYSRHQRRG